MKEITTLIKQQQQHTTQKSTQHSTTQSEQPISDHEKKATAYLYLQLSRIYGRKFTSAFPDELSISESKRTWFKQIGEFSREQIDSGLEKLKDEIIKGKHTWCDIPDIINLIKDKEECWEHNSAAYKITDPAQLLEQKNNALPREEQRKRIQDLKKLF